MALLNQKKSYDLAEALLRQAVRVHSALMGFEIRKARVDASPGATAVLRIHLTEAQLFAFEELKAEIAASLETIERKLKDMELIAEPPQPVPAPPPPPILDEVW